MADILLAVREVREGQYQVAESLWQGEPFTRFKTGVSHLNHLISQGNIQSHQDVVGASWDRCPVRTTKPINST